MITLQKVTQNKIIIEEKLSVYNNNYYLELF